MAQISKYLANWHAGGGGGGENESSAMDLLQLIEYA